MSHQAVGLDAGLNSLWTKESYCFLAKPAVYNVIK